MSSFFNQPQQQQASCNPTSHLSQMAQQTYHTQAPEQQTYYTQAPQQPMGNLLPVSYPYILTAKKIRSLLSPDGTNVIMTVQYPSSFALQNRLSFRRGQTYTQSTTLGTAPEMAEAIIHSFTSSKIDVTVFNEDFDPADPEAPHHKYRFKKKFDSLTGLGHLVWSVDDGQLFLSRDTEDGPIVARFAPDADSGGKKALNSAEAVEGRFVFARDVVGRLTDEQFEEIFVTGIAELERIRTNNEGEEVGKAMGEVVQSFY